MSDSDDDHLYFEEFEETSLELMPFIEPELPQPLTEGVLFLGYDRNTFYYYSMSQQQVTALTPAQHTQTQCLALADLAHGWEQKIDITCKNGKGEIIWPRVFDYMMTQCRAAGIYNPDKIRGRGAWLDNNRPVLHLGDKLIVNGEPSPLMLVGSKYVYEAAQPLAAVVAPPLPTRDANRLVLICRGLAWAEPIHGTLLAGWLAVAPICGGLAWRPSIWITGSSGSGKSWVYDNILFGLLRNIALPVASNTSEAGIRQTLNNDARPVLFDEAEGEDAGAANRLQAVLSLMRQAASEGGSEIIKGTQNQSGAKRYRIRSCFAFNSINIGTVHQADESRLTILPLRMPPTDPESQRRWAEFSADAIATLTAEYSAGLVARSVSLLPVIRRNAETFAQAVAERLRSKRLGDQLGTLLAGAYSLHSSGVITLDAAREFVARENLTTAGEHDAQRDEDKLWSHLTQHRVRVQSSNVGMLEITIGRLILAAWGTDTTILGENAETELKQIGIKPVTDAVLISTNHPALKRILIGTPWAGSYSRTLLRLDGVVSFDKTVRFGPGHVGKAVYVPRKLLQDE
jgi:putative DNA primase/helicase